MDTIDEGCLPKTQIPNFIPMEYNVSKMFPKMWKVTQVINAFYNLKVGTFRCLRTEFTINIFQFGGQVLASFGKPFIH